MFALIFGTIFTMVVVPEVCVTLNRLQSPEQGVEPAAADEAVGQPA